MKKVDVVTLNSISDEFRWAMDLTMHKNTEIYHTSELWKVWSRKERLKLNDKKSRGLSGITLMIFVIILLQRYGSQIRWIKEEI